MHRKRQQYYRQEQKFKNYLIKAKQSGLLKLKYLCLSYFNIVFLLCHAKYDYRLMTLPPEADMDGWKVEQSEIRQRFVAE